MQAQLRQQRLEDYIQKVEFASLTELAQYVAASPSTVRRDLAVLEKTGTILRTHGGARLTSPKSDEFAFSIRDTQQLAEKEAIGQLCASLIKPGQSVIIDAGTTADHVARHLQKSGQIITNSLPVANLFAGASHVEVVVTGGVIYPQVGVLVGPLAIEGFSKIHADVAIMSAGGITIESVTNSHALLIEIQRTMIKAAEKVILCLDHTKLGRRSLSSLCDLEVVDTLVTDSQAPPEIIEALRARNMEVIIGIIER